MKESAKYVNHAGRSIELNADGIRLSSGELADWETGYTLLNGRISSFAAEPREMPISAVVACGSSEEGMAKREKLYEVAALDVEARKPGRLYIGGWYMTGYVVASRKGRYWHTGAAADYDLTFASDKPHWTKEHERSFYPLTAGGDSFLDYPHDYPYDYRLSLSNQRVDNPGFLPAPLKLTIYGPATHPRIVIDGNVHEVETVLEAGDILTVDGLLKTIAVKKSNGAEVNAFPLRRGVQRAGSGSYVFEKIEPGMSDVYWDGSFGFDMVIYEQRAERRWS